MKLLITAGNTLVPIDKVRAITNIFTGRTGTAIALTAQQRGHQVILLTSHPEVVDAMRDQSVPLAQRWNVHRYRTFDDLQEQMQALIQQEPLDAIVHCAAVSDYRSAGIYAPAEHTHFDPEQGQWQSTRSRPTLIDRAAGKVKSNEDELWLRLVRTPKIVDLIRTDWNYRGLLVKFKLEVGVSEEKLLEIAERSRQQSSADLMVANTLEGAGHWAFLGPVDGEYQRVSRRELSERLLERLEQLQGK